MANVDINCIGKRYSSGDNSVDNITLNAANDAIQSHPVEVVGRELRGHMSAMKAIAVGA